MQDEKRTSGASDTPRKGKEHRQKELDADAGP